VNQNGYTLYHYTPDKQGKPTCTGVCAQYWPAFVLAKGQMHPLAGKGVSGLGTVKSGGKLQVTWDKWPLYRYSGDTKPGQVNGQGVMGVWYVLKKGAAAAGGGGPTTTAGKGYY